MSDMVDGMRGAMNLMNQYQQMRQNPRKFFTEVCGVNIPDNVNVNDPNAIAQYVLNSGIKTQQEYNQVSMLRGNPFLQKMFNIQ